MASIAKAAKGLALRRAVAATATVREGLGRFAAQLSSFILPAALLALWILVAARGWIKSYQLASPSEVLRELVGLAQSGLLWSHLAASAERVFFGFALAFAAATLLGLIVGLSKAGERLLDPTLQAIRSVPSLAWVPLLLLWLGIGEQAKIALVGIGAFFPIYVNLVAGIHGVDRKLVEVGQVLGLSRLRLALKVVLPAATPSLLVGARIGLTQAWLFLVAAELLASTRGLGYMLTEGEQIARTDEILAAILLLALCGKITEGFAKAVERRALSWRDSIGS